MVSFGDGGGRPAFGLWEWKTVGDEGVTGSVYR